MSVKLKKYNTQTIERTWTKCEKNVMAYGQKQYDNFNATPQLMGPGRIMVLSKTPA